MPSILSKLTTLIPNNLTTAASSTRTSTILALTAAPPLIYLLASLPSILTSYRTFLAIGPGGLPHNFFGFLLQASLRVVARSDVRAVPPPYCHFDKSKSGGEGKGEGEADLSHPDPAVVKKYAPLGRTSFILSPAKAAASASDGGGGGGGGGGGAGGTAAAGGGLPVREGSRPTVPPFVAPQRQTSGQASSEMIARMEGFLQHLAGKNEGVLEMRPSGLEGAWHDAVFLKAGAGADDGDRESERESRKGVEVPEYMGRAKGEIVHVHSEGSSHVTVSLVDGEEAVGKGWAERHPLSGVGNVLPWSYIMLYAPRDDEEYEVWTRLVVAGCRFVSGGKDIKMIES